MDVVDFHAHILPECDHGSSSVETSLAQLEYAITHGVRRIAATSHYYPHREDVKSFTERRALCYNALADAMKQRGADLPEIKLGAEVLICDNIDELPDLSELCLEGTRALLLELPFTDFSSSYVKTVKYLIHDGYDVILAHADRYKKENIEQLIAVGAKIQLNAKSICKLFGNRHLFDWIRRGIVVAVGSDIHGADEGAYKTFERALKKIGAAGVADIKRKSDDIFM